MTIDSRQVSKEIKEQIKPWLKEQGFQKITARNALRISDDTIEVINFQSFNSYNASVMGVTTFSFSVTLGVYYRFCNLAPWFNAHVLEEPKYYECHAVRAILKGIKQPKIKDESVWFISKDGSNLSAMVADAKEQLVTFSQKWFEEFKSPEQALFVFQNRPESYSKSAGLYERLGGLGHSLSRAEIVSFLALKTGNVDQAVTFWRKLKESDFYNKHQSIVDDAECKIKQLSEVISITTSA